VQAIGRNPVRAAAMGYSVGGYRVTLTLYASLIASLGGWLYILQNSFVHQDLLGLGNSTNGLVYALIGGVNSILGPFLGAILLRFVNDTLSRGSTQTPLYLGIVLMLVVYFVPDGLLGLWDRYGPGRHYTAAPTGEPTEASAAGPSAEKLEAV
jgi:branched-chain amino acid transport system permease protein